MMNQILPRAVRAVSLVALAASAAVAQDQRTLPVFENGEAQVVPGFADRKSWIQHDLWVETEFDTDGDGKKDRMHVDVTRPGQTDTEGLKVPVIYETSPYYNGVAGTNPRYFWDPKHALGATPPKRTFPPGIRARIRRPLISRSHIGTWLPRGFAVVHSASPGTGLSQGCPTVGGTNESLAPKAVVDWLCGRAKGFTSPDGNEEVKATWCSGKVGMTGTSYNGTLPIACATTGVEGLEAIIPIAPNTSYYHYYRSHGLVRHPGGYMGEDIDVLFDFIHSGDPQKREHCNCKVRDELMMVKQDRITGDYNDFWAGRDYANQLGKYKAATLMAHAWNDWNVMPEHSVRIYELLKQKGVPVQCYFHQGGHGGQPPLRMMNRWFTRYLYGVENDVEKDPKAWIVRTGEGRMNPTAYPDYPHPQAEFVRLHPNRGGLDEGALSTESKGSQGVEKLVDDVAMRGSQLAQASLPHRLIYATPELTKPVHISGTPKIRIRLSCNKKWANLSVWLVSLPWTKRGKIYENVITRGWADPQNHASIRKSKPLEPGRFYDVEFDLQPDDQIIPVGAKIGVMIFSSDRDFTLWPPPGTELTVDLDYTSLKLPIVGGAQALEAAMQKPAEDGDKGPGKDE